MSMYKNIIYVCVFIRCLYCRASPPIKNRSRLCAPSAGDRPPYPDPTAHTRNASTSRLSLGVDEFWKAGSRVGALRDGRRCRYPEVHEGYQVQTAVCYLSKWSTAVCRTEQHSYCCTALPLFLRNREALSPVEVENNLNSLYAMLGIRLVTPFIPPLAPSKWLHCCYLFKGAIYICW